MPKSPGQVLAEIKKREAEAARGAAAATPAPVAAAPPPAPKPAPTTAAPAAKAAPKPAAKPTPPAPVAKVASKPAPAPVAEAPKKDKSDERLRREADAAFAKLSPEDRAAFEPPTFAPAKSLDEKVEQQEALERWRTGTPVAKVVAPPVPSKSTVGAAADFVRPDEETVRTARTVGNFAAGLAGRAGTETIAQAAALIKPGGATDEIVRDRARDAVRDTLNPAIDAQFASTAKAVREDAEADAAMKPVNAWEDAPENKPLIERAIRIQQAGGNRSRQQMIRSFLEGEAKENRRIAVAKLGGEDKITDDAVSDAIDKAAREKARSDLLKLHQVGTWAPDIRPEDLDPDAPDTRSYSGKVWDAFRPQSTITAIGRGGNQNVVSSTENLPWWFVTTVFDAPVFGIQAEFDRRAGDDFADAFLRNVEERRSPITARLEVDEELRADLASGDLGRAAKHFGDPSFVATLGIEFLSPDIVTTAAGAATASARVAKAAKKATAVASRAGEVSALLKADKQLSTLDAIRQVGADIDAESAPAEIARQKVLKYVDTIEQTYADTGDIEAAAATIEASDSRARRAASSVVAPEGQTAAKVLRDAYLAKLNEDTEVAAYLEHLGPYKGRIPPKSERVPVEWGDAQKADLDNAVADLDDLSKQKAEIVQGVADDIAERMKAGETIPEDKLRGMQDDATRAIDAEIDAATKRAARLKALEQTAAGESKFDAAVKQAGDDIVAEWGRIARGEAKPVEAPTPDVSPESEGYTKVFHGGTVEGDFDAAKTSADSAYGRGVYFTNNPDHAAGYGAVNEAYVKLEKPFDLGAQVSAEEASRLLGKPTTRPMSGKDLWARLRGAPRSKEEARQVLAAAGYDGIRVPGNEDSGEWIIAFDAKSTRRPAPTPVEVVEDTAAAAGPKPRIDPAELQRAFGGDVSPALAARIAEAKTPEEVIKALRGASQATKDAVARRLGAADYDAFVKTMAGTDAEVDVARTVAQARVDEARTKATEAQDNYLALAAAPEEMARLAAAKKTLKAAEKEVADADAALASASKVNVEGRAKTREKVAKAAAAEAELARLRAEGPPAADSDALERKRIRVEVHGAAAIKKQKERTIERLGGLREKYAKAEAAPIPKSRKLLALEQKIEAQQAILDNMKATDAARATKQAAIDKMNAEADALSDADVAAWNRARAKEREALGMLEAEQAAKEAAVNDYWRDERQKYEEAVAAANGTLGEKNAAAIKDAEAAAIQARAAADEALVKQQRAEVDTNAAFEAAQTRRADAGAKYDAARAAYDTTPKPRDTVPGGVAGDERIANAKQAALKADKKLADLEAAAQEIDKLPEARENLRAALAAAQAEYASLAEALGKQAEDISAAQKAAKAPLPKGSDPALEYTDDLAALGRRFEYAARDLRRLNRGDIQVVIENIYDTFRGIGGQYGDVEEQSLSEAAKEIGRRLDGEMREIDVSLSKAVDATDATSDEMNMTALGAVAKHLANFKIGLRAGQMDGKYVALAATAYLNPRAISTLPRETGAKLLKIVRDWAGDSNSSIEGLRAALLEASRSIAADSSGMRAAQQGDVFLAQAIGKGGVERGVIQDMGYQGLAYGKSDAEAVNSVLQATFDRTNATGGNKHAARGRELASRLISDPHLYQNPKKGWLDYISDSDTGTRDDVTTPLVKAVEAAPSKGAEKGIEALFEAEEAVRLAEATRLAGQRATDEVVAAMKGDRYIPRALRDKMLKHVEAATATTNLASRRANWAAYQKFWQQVAVVGAGLSRPIQFLLDPLGDYLRLFIMSGEPPWRSFAMATKAAARSLPSHLLGAPAMAQMMWIMEHTPKNLRAPVATGLGGALGAVVGGPVGAAIGGAAGMAVGLGTRAADGSFGSGARAFDKWISNLVFTSPIDKVLARSMEEWRPGITYNDLYLQFRNGGLYENSFASQYTRSVEQAVDNASPLTGGAVGVVKGALSGAVVGGPTGVLFGGAAGAIFGATPQGRRLASLNVRYLQDVQNVVATRRRAAVAFAFLEAGRSPAEATKRAVEVVGDFSRELGPAERGFFSTMFPFWAYRKFAVRTAVTNMLLNPENAWKANMVAKTGEGLSAGLSIAFDSDDEYGYHPTVMKLEADYEYVQRIKDELVKEKGIDFLSENDGWWESEARARADNGYTDAAGVEHPPAPRAIERYERAMEELRKWSYSDGEAFIQSSGMTIPESELVELRNEAVRNGAQDIESEAQALGRKKFGGLAKDLSYLDAYFAPNPRRHMLPKWAQGKPAVFVQKDRSQASDAYFHAGTGKYERVGDEIRFALLPQDPFTEGMGIPLLIAAAALNIAPGEGLGADNGEAFTELIAGMFSDPVVIQTMSELNLATAAGMNSRVVIPTKVGENLQALGVPVHVSPKVYRGQDPTSDGKDKYKDVYSLDASMVAALYMIPPLTQEPMAALDFMKAAEALQGDAPFVRGVPDAVDKASVAASLGLGMRAYTSSPSMEASYVAKDVEARLKAANEKRGLVVNETPVSWVGNLREMGRAKKRADFDAAAEEMLVRVRGGDPGPGDVALARAWLAKQFPGSEESLARLKDHEVFASVQGME